MSLELCEHTCLPDATMAGVLGAVRHTLERFIMRQSLSGPPQLHCLEPAGAALHHSCPPLQCARCSGSHTPCWLAQEPPCRRPVAAECCPVKE